MATLSEEVDVLRRIPLFAAIDPGKLKLLAFASDRMVYRDAQNVFRQGEVGDAAYVIVRGAADVVVETPAGEIVVAKLGENADVPRTATVTAKTPLLALRIDKETFFRLVNEFPQMAVEIMRELAQRLEKSNQQLRSVVAAARQR